LSRIVAAIVLVLLATAPGAMAQETFDLSSGGAVFPDRTYVIKLDRERQLQARDVRVSENGTRIRNSVVQSAASAGGVGTILLIDASNSMRGRPVEAAMNAARAFARRNPDQPLGIIAFNDRVETLLPLTENRRAIEAALAKTPQNREGTHIYDALGEAARQLASRGIDVGRVVLLSDGQEVGSTVTRESALERLEGTGTRVYSVGLQSYAFDAGYLEELAEETGGTYAEAASSDALAGIYDALGYRFANEYLVRYRSPAGPGEDVDVEIAIGDTSQTISYVTPRIGSGGPFSKSIWDRIIQSWLVVPLIVLCVLALVIYAVRSFLNTRATRRFRARLSEFVDMDPEERARRRRTEVAELLAIGPDRASRINWQPLRRLAADMDISGIRTPLGTVLGFTLLGMLLLGILAAVLLGPLWILLGVVVPFAVHAEIKRRATATRKLFAEQLPDNLEVVASSLRAGHSLAGALGTVVEEAQPPSLEEFRRVVTDEQLGVPLDEALEVTAQRMDNRDMYQVAMVAMLSREAGGNVAGVLDQVIVNVRARADLNRTVRVLTAQGRMARWIISFIPLALMGLIGLVSPSYLSPLFNTSAGQTALVFAVILVAVGFYVISRIAAFEA
jgi:tight adherence protein B